MKRFVVLLLCMVSVAGCAKRRQVEEARFDEKENSHVMLLVADMSGSFDELMSERAYNFMLQIIEKYLRDRAGQPDRLILAQVSGTSQIVWEGSVHEFRKQLDREKIRALLKKGADPNQSKIITGLHHAIQYALSDSRIQEGKAKLGVFVLSDWLDSGCTHEEEGYLNHDLSVIGLQDGVVGCYYVAQQQVVPLKQRLLVLNVKNSRVESEIVGGKPTLPSFE